MRSETTPLPVARFDAPPVQHKTATVEGVRVFYREAGPLDAPVIVLLHGFPSSSRMFGALFPLLSSRFRLIAPDFPGFGHSDAPSPADFAYTFDQLADCVRQFLDQLKVNRYALYLQDYGGPIGFRLAIQNPERVTALIIQNAVAHVEGLSEAWAIRKAWWLDRKAHEPKIRDALLSEKVAQQRHLAGVSQPELVDPDMWSQEFAFLTRPGMAWIQLELAFDYQSNVAAYPEWQAYLRDKRPPTLVVWGKHDPLFTVAGALAFSREVPDAETHLLNASHFALDEEPVLIAELVRHFLDSKRTAAC
jgi:pimeloyl-ACP methyl ester carboxylesterase